MHEVGGEEGLDRSLGRDNMSIDLSTHFYFSVGFFLILVNSLHCVDIKYY